LKPPPELAFAVCADTEGALAAAGAGAAEEEVAPVLPQAQSAKHSTRKTAINPKDLFCVFTVSTPFYFLPKLRWNDLTVS
jgi:hypothetical protein